MVRFNKYKEIVLPLLWSGESCRFMNFLNPLSQSVVFSWSSDSLNKTVALKIVFYRDVIQLTWLEAWIYMYVKLPLSLLSAFPFSPVSGKHPGVNHHR